MDQNTVKQILEIEQQAADIYAQAQEQSQNILTTAEQKSAALRKEILERTREQSQKLVDAGRDACDATHARIIAEAEAASQHLKTLAVRNFDDAVRFILNQITECE